MSAETKFEYFEYDGVVFRRPAGGGGACTEVNSGTGWRKAEGEDRNKAKAFGTQLSEAEAEKFLAAA